MEIKPLSVELVILIQYFILDTVSILYICVFVGTSELYIVMCRTGKPDSKADGISCLLVPKSSSGLSFGSNENKLG